MNDAIQEWPATVDVAVGVLLRLLPDGELERITNMEKEDLSIMHSGLGLWIREDFGLLQGNQALIESAGGTNADDASAVIIEALWQRLKENVPKLQ
jgi:hypothetical protein